jgi:integrase
MNRKSSSTRLSKGSVGIEEKQGKYRIRLPRKVAEDSARYLSTGLTTSPENYRLVLARVYEIEQDIEQGLFDITLEKYRQQLIPPQRITIESLRAARHEVDIVECWSRYHEYKKVSLAPGTFGTYNTVSRVIARLPNIRISDDAARLNKQWLLEHCARSTQGKVLTYLSAACDLAIDDGLIKLNPYKRLTLGSWTKRKQPDEIQPFTRAERDAILEAYAKHRFHRHYYHFIKFLFLTGCRTGEATGIQWKRIASDNSYILFTDSYSKRLKIRKPTKNKKTRKFPCNAALRELIAQLRQAQPNASGDDLVFTAKRGGIIDNERSGERIGWHEIVDELVRQGKVSEYRSIYNTRHSFATMALEGGLTIPQVARLLGNTPKMVMEHYAGSVVSVDVPVD